MHDLIVIGGGPAGTAAAITAARRGARVLLLEAGRYPRHKVCGEFVSPEALGLLTALLGENRVIEHAARIKRARLFLDGRVFEAAIKPPAASIARFVLDAALWRAAEQSGVECAQQVSAERITPQQHGFQVDTNCGSFETRALIDAAGRWSKLNAASRPQAGPVWLGLKAHFATRELHDSTDLYFFKGGYCGVQPVGPGRLNACAMVRSDIARTMDEVLARHPRLAEASRGWQRVMEPVATSPLIFRTPTPVREGVLCAGDAAGFIDPFVGDGIALALRSGVAAAESLCESAFDAAKAAGKYRMRYQREFVPLFRAASRLRRLLGVPRVIRAVVLPLLHVPAVGEFVVKKTRAA